VTVAGPKRLRQLLLDATYDALGVLVHTSCGSAFPPSWANRTSPC